MQHLRDLLLESVDDSARIFIIIKPGFLQYSASILKRFAQDGWDIERSKTKLLLLKEARALYRIHKEEGWYKPLCDYMSSGPTEAFILKNKNIKMSPAVFDEVKTIKDELREKYGESDMRNVLHSSDSIGHMMTEKSIYFAF